jgi:hypothetical protein
MKDGGFAEFVFFAHCPGDKFRACHEIKKLFVIAPVRLL